MSGSTDNAADAARGNANLLLTQSNNLPTTLSLGFAAVTFALMDLAEAIREHGK